MKSTKENNEVILRFSKDEAIVFLDFLGRFNEDSNSSVFQDQSEKRILFDLEAILEKTLTEVLQTNYNEILVRARENVRDKN